jgi:hypothetical protein
MRYNTILFLQKFVKNLMRYNTIFFTKFCKNFNEIFEYVNLLIHPSIVNLRVIMIFY